MNVVEWMISEKVAKNGFNAAHIANGLKLYELKDDAAIMARCRLYRKWRNAGEPSAVAYQNAIDGKEVSSLDDYAASIPGLVGVVAEIEPLKDGELDNAQIILR